MNSELSTMKSLVVTVLLMCCFLQGVQSQDPCKLKNNSLIKIAENVTVGSVIGQFDVIGTNDDVTLQQTSSGPFRLNSTTREITVEEPLDFESLQSNNIRIEAQCSYQNLNIRLFRMIVILDINDNTPVFTSDHYYVNVSESAKVNSIIFSGISATDGDFNQYLQYDVIPGPYSSWVDFERSSQGEVTLKKQLDYETLQSFTVEISVLDTPSDVRSPRRSATANLTITVQNEDDMEPAFSQDHYDAVIPSTTQPGTRISTAPEIYAEDQDLHFKSPIIYSIWEYREAFRIDPQTGEVWLQKQLEGGWYTAVLKATQADNTMKQNVSTLTVLVTGGGGGSGVSNRPPTFMKDTYEIQVYENTPVNQILLNVPATDPDMGPTLTYQLKDTIGGIFEISEKADIKLKKQLDFEDIQVYSLEVSVTDKTFTSTTTVKVTVLDVNDNSPEIVNPDIYVEANRDPNSLLATIKASDKDASSLLTYSLIGDAQLFAVNDRGEVFMKGQPEDFPLTEYSFVILVEDNGDPPRQASSHIRISLPQRNSTEAPTNAAILAEPNDALPIVLGVVAAILLFVVIVLAILLVRRKKRPGNSTPQNETESEVVARKIGPENSPPQTENESEAVIGRAFQDENLEKVKPPSHLDPEGLAYRPTAKPSNGMFPSTLELNLDPDHGESEDGATTIQHNPISAINHGYSGSDMSEGGHDMDDIRIQTSMTPYNNNGYPGYVEDDMYGTGTKDLKSFRHSGSSNESLSSDSTPGSKKQLVKPDLMEHGQPKGMPFPWNNLNGSMAPNSNEDLAQDGRRSADDKPEITVYF